MLLDQGFHIRHVLSCCHVYLFDVKSDKSSDDFLLGLESARVASFLTALPESKTSGRYSCRWIMLQSGMRKINN